MLTRLIAALLLLLSASAARAAPPAPPLVLAAASLQESMTAAADAWATQGHPRPVVSFAGSSALARQIEAGARADLFVSADEAWMDAIAAKHLIVPATRVTFLGNRLVIVAPAASRVRAPAGGARLARFLSAGPLAMADPAVPAGKYGRTALVRLGVLSAVQPHIVSAENVRATLALVERGVAPLGIVYATDARASAKVRIAGVFPETTHPPITYPVARLAASTNAEGEGFRRFLLSRAGKAIFVRYGFSAR
ncbi:molybdate ABC transporter substrate-binding protein [Sphingomonas sp. H39-1-10]|uniref:molybdate ABC transporter substrate-binding protein n=1 Tax=Sphingomonas pollutisoli TaxID=3030829 RepID=UPI0023B93D78|nr:molybdate ABC transporter substrate-binding protein [Sphingomonas pollutisoli]MDF0488803.1 molybdate ABC transporter substrate-binding protein [Sphingomonas pollutisoli]